MHCLLLLNGLQASFVCGKVNLSSRNGGCLGVPSPLFLRVRGPNAQVRAAHVVSSEASPITAGQSETNFRLGNRNIPNLESGIARESGTEGDLLCRIGPDRSGEQRNDRIG